MTRTSFNSGAKDRNSLFDTMPLLYHLRQDSSNDGLPGGQFVPFLVLPAGKAERSGLPLPVAIKFPL